MSEHNYDRGCHCDTCRASKARYQNLRRLDALRGQPRYTDGIGTRRRLQALHRIGWSSEEIGHELGCTRIAVNNLMRREGPVRRSTARKIARVYDRLSNTTPPPMEGKAAGVRNRLISRAARQGWPAPICWDDDIDDPDATPWQDERGPGSRQRGGGVVNVDSLTDCANWGLDVAGAADRLGVDKSAIEHGIPRHAPHLHEKFTRNAIAKGLAA